MRLGGKDTEASGLFTLGGKDTDPRVCPHWAVNGSSIK